ncbi:hypothetical protein AQAU111925_09295 [Aquirufa aurantiipilula]
MDCESPAVCELFPVITNLDAAPALIKTTSLPVIPPVVEVKVKVPVPVTPVYLMPKLVKLATPLVKSPAWFNTLVEPEPNPVTTPPKLFVTVTELALASKLETVLP